MKRIAGVFVILLSLSIGLFAQRDSVYVLNGTPIEIKDTEKAVGGRITLTLSTINQDSISVSFHAFSSQGTTAKWGCRLQYRTDKNGAWKDVADKRHRAIEFLNTRYASSQKFSALLPEDCSNRDEIQISWKIYQIRGKGNNPNLGVRNIELRSNNDPFTQSPQIFVENKDNARLVNESIVFNNIALPYTYPDLQRLNIYGFYLRGDISLQIEGEDKDEFHLSNKTISMDSLSNKTITLYYVPRKEGNHRAYLSITTKKLSSPVRIPLIASAANKPPLGENQFPNSIISIHKEIKEKRNNTVSHPVFSNTKYLFKFNLLTSDSKNLNIKYSWYRDTTLLEETNDRVEEKDYRTYITSPLLANNIKITFECEKALTLYNVYFGSPEVKTMIRSGDWSNETNWQNKEKPLENDFVNIDNNVKAEVFENVFCTALTLGDNSNVRIRTNRTFYISDNIIYGKNAYFTVEQSLLPQKWNYIAPAINNTKAYTFSMRRSDNETWLMEYNTGIISEHSDHWSQYITDPEFVLEAGHGYAVYTQKPLNVKYEGILNNASVSVPLVSQNKDRWNFVSNPFTAPLDSRKLYADIDGKIQGNAIFMLDTLGFYNPIIIDDRQTIIPALSAFFVEALKTNSEITFKRSQQYTFSNDTPNRERKNFLVLSAGDKAQSRIIFQIKAAAKNGFDPMDTHKLFGTSTLPEIYSIANGEELSINSFATIPASFGIGLYSRDVCNSVISLSHLSSLEAGDVSIVFEDREENLFYDLCENASIKMIVPQGTTADRFRLHFVKPLQIVADLDIKDIYLWTDEGRILIFDNDNLLEEITVRKDDKVIIQKEYPLRDGRVLVIENGNIDRSCVIDLKINGKTYRDFYVNL
ncbi:MAG: hypothetical protein LBR17_02505 [Bacteroidales bacterium]|jgi:hypothetical protein|nr:hypothetical protein [Bacteroidales bacterium]